MKQFSFFVFLVFAISCKSDKNQTVKPISIEFEKEGELLFLTDTDTIIKLDIEFAQTDYEQQTGLMHREDMEMTQGMLFIYEDEQPRPAFYMKNTKMALDLIYINSDFRVVEINRDTKPYNESPIGAQQPAQYVLEVNAGFADKYKITDSLKIDFKKQ
jgi:uncharacterized membrane protein (UPF0127 family)